ncbi:MAG: aminopeptidase P family protein [Candidatus Cloacimonetes bacterium]|nr:aminopeptidase P family protein [Candidatus Cloacimonadota bacterium]
MLQDMLQSRRKKLEASLNEGETVIIFAAEPINYPAYFLQESNFFYFTGLDTPNAVLFQIKYKDKLESMLFIERGIPEREVWDGKKTTVAEATRESGIEKVYYLDEFYDKISSWLVLTRKCWINLGNRQLLSSPNRAQMFVSAMREKNPQILYDDTSELLRKFRAVKDKWEIEQIRQAIAVTREGILTIFSQARARMMEFELEAILNYEVYRRGLRHFGFKAIIASGINAAILHYIENNSKINAGDLVLLDVGARCNNYSADITRTFPVSGKFNGRQEKIYSAVLSVQKAVIAMIKPGVSLIDLNKRTEELITKELLDLKLIDDEKDFRKYYMHSVSHHLGLDTHDIGARDSVLEKGNVITVEPGIYVPEERIGIRIEDDILVTARGCEVLSASIPKEIEDLEKLCGIQGGRK